MPTEDPAGACLLTPCTTAAVCRCLHPCLMHRCNRNRKGPSTMHKAFASPHARRPSVGGHAAYRAPAQRCEGRCVRTARRMPAPQGPLWRSAGSGRWTLDSKAPLGSQRRPQINRYAHDFVAHVARRTDHLGGPAQGEKQHPREPVLAVLALGEGASCAHGRRTWCQHPGAFAHPPGESRRESESRRRPA